MATYGVGIQGSPAPTILGFDLSTSTKPPTKVSSSVPTFVWGQCDMWAEGVLKQVTEKFLLCTFTILMCYSDTPQLLANASLSLHNCHSNAGGGQNFVLYYAQIWFTQHNLESTHWHVSITPQYHKLLSVQVGKDVLQATVMPFGLSIALRISSKRW